MLMGGRVGWAWSGENKLKPRRIRATWMHFENGVLASYCMVHGD